MTSVTKRYMELGDLRGVVISCLDCKAALMLPLNADRLAMPTHCPNCRIEWSDPPLAGLPPTRAQDLDAFFQAFRRLQRSLDGKSAPVRFSLGIEVAEP